MRTSGNIQILILFILSLACNTISADTIESNPSIKVYRFKIDKMIAPPIWRTTKLRYRECTEK